MTYYLSMQADDPFWKRKSEDKPVKNPRLKTKASKKPMKRRNIEPSEPIIDDALDNPDSEVELDSLGSFFIHLIDNDHYQDEAEASHADEVTIPSSDSDPVPVPRIRRAIRKVKFSCPLSYSDPHFLLKTQQHEARHTTRHSGQVVTSSGLPNSPVHKRLQEVAYTPDTLYPKAGYIRYPLNPSDSNYQGTSHSSSGESSATQLPPLKTVPG